jgi:hypothetical protein
LSYLWAVVLGFAGARSAVTLQASTGLGTNTYAVADLDAVLNVISNADGLANDLVANDARVGGGTPAGLKSVDVGTADTAVSDLDLFLVSATLP